MENVDVALVAGGRGVDLESEQTLGPLREE
jgi:hypothetical protein